MFLRSRLAMLHSQLSMHEFTTLIGSNGLIETKLMLNNCSEKTKCDDDGEDNVHNDDNNNDDDDDDETTTTTTTTTTMMMSCFSICLSLDLNRKPPIIVSPSKGEAKTSLVSNNQSFRQIIPGSVE